ncbi:carboxypeptidase regulatory-like domain-containing protein [Pajaroellobacter abortibovis]|uniref:PEGA domain-containing protein n=1 Tax=Pajaroellobacter abortibovis TaxID=1882918 RepID=A0A1L6MXN0_9BACT|nr:carboxypeptidase regulatory-like domain-containing protein [Pajaroellobacter abortibovis]APS00158.1 hypothetical protein BCY86_05285 [Pajaroellobacter abortibovis]
MNTKKRSPVPPPPHQPEKPSPPIRSEASKVSDPAPSIHLADELEPSVIPPPVQEEHMQSSLLEETIAAPIPLPIEWEANPNKPNQSPSKSEILHSPISPNDLRKRQDPRAYLPSQTAAHVQKESAMGTTSLKKKKRLVGGGLITLTLLIAMGALRIWLNQGGEINLSASDSKGGSAISNLTVLLDKNKLVCQTTPCTLKNIPPGEHILEVEAKGYQPHPAKIITVQVGNATIVDFSMVQLALSGLQFRTSLSSGQLSIDGQTVTGIPQEPYPLSPGSHTIRFEAGERYEPVEKKILLQEGTIEEVVLNPKVIQGKLTLQLGTPGARVFLFLGKQKKIIHTFPFSIELKPDQRYRIEARKKGYDPFEQNISFEDGQAEKVISLALTSTSREENTKHYHHRTKHTEQEEDSDDDTSSQDEGNISTSTQADKNVSFLNINSIPPALIQLDGKSLGNTPKLNLTVSPGSHTILFTNKEEGIQKTMTITLKPGETKTAAVKLRE